MNQKKLKMNQIILSKVKSLHRVIRIVFLALFFFIVNEVVAQEVYDLTRCIQTGLERNFSLQVVRNYEEIAKNDYTKGNAGMLPTISLTSRYGGTVNSSKQDYVDEVVNSSGVLNTYGSAAVNLGMDIFRGFQVKNTYQKLGNQFELGGLSTQMSIENLVAQIVSEYNYYIQQLTLYKNLAYAVSLSRERLRIDEERYLLGSASKVEFLQSMVYLNADSSRYSRQKEILHNSQVKLNELMASENLGQKLILKDSLIKIREDLLYDDLLENTLDYNTGLKIAAKNQIISELDYKIIKSRSYPYLTMSTGYGYNYNKYGTGTLLNQDVHGLNYGFTLGFDIFDGFNRSREKNNALIVIENKKIQYNEIEQEVTADLLTIYYAYENNLRLLRLEEQNLEVARENLEIALERYKLGSLSGIELREVQKSLLDAEERLILVKYQTKLAEISLLQISGRIMEYI
ncbi:MAG TPA: TolC family protein [Bacteroidales bacterium]|nr:TolC family protein [Bacteroidales bacterium]